jgi:hypothetical protein
MVTQATGENFSEMQENNIVTNVRIDRLSESDSMFSQSDEFAKSLDDYSKVGGLSHNFRRQMKRKSEKADKIGRAHV